MANIQINDSGKQKKFRRKKGQTMLTFLCSKRFAALVEQASIEGKTDMSKFMRDAIGEKLVAVKVTLTPDDVSVPA